MSSTGRGSRRESRGVIGVVLAATGILIAVVGIAIAIFSAGVSIAIEAVGIVLGIAAYSLGAGKPGTVTIVLCLVSMFPGLAADQGLIPGIGGFDPRQRKGGFVGGWSG